ncbi:MAG: FAD-dependent oxidoreductase, partial [Mesorhizobium sp.]
MSDLVVKRLPAESGISGWEAISRRCFPVRTLDGDIKADWLIIGGGFA